MVPPERPVDYLRGELSSNQEESNDEKIIPGQKAPQNKTTGNKEIMALENKIENLIPKYNSVVVENRMIREKIDALRKEKNFSWMKILGYGCFY